MSFYTFNDQWRQAGVTQNTATSPMLFRYAQFYTEQPEMKMTSFLRKVFIRQKKDQNTYPPQIRLTPDNVKDWPKYFNLLKSGKIKFDSKGRLRYLHGAPVGDLQLVSNNEVGEPTYRESAEQWFDPESPTALVFCWE